MNHQTIENLRRLAERPGTTAEGTAARAAIKRLQDSNRKSTAKVSSSGTFHVADSIDITADDDLDQAFDSLLQAMQDRGL